MMKCFLPFVTLLVGVVAQNTVIDDLDDRISPGVTKLANDVQGFPGSGLEGALEIDSDSKNLAIIFNDAAENARLVGSFSPTDGVTILADLSPITNTMVDLLEGLSAKKDNFNRLVLPAGLLILSDLQLLNQSSLEYIDTLVQDTPVTQIPAAVAIRSTWAGAFAQTLADYSSEA